MFSTEDLQKVKEIRDSFESQIMSGVNTIAELSLSSRYYEQLKPYVEYRLRHPINCDIVFVYMLVQYTMRKYSGADFYDSFCTAMCGQRFDSSYIKDCIKGTIEKYHLQDFGYFQTGNREQYAECIKAHSFSYFAKQEGLLDSSRKIFEWLGCNIQDKEIVKRELFYIQQKARSTSSSTTKDKDVDIVFGSDRSEKKAPRLSMAASTIRFFSSVSTDTLMKVYYPVLQLIDNWYYPEDEPNQISHNKIDWIEPSFGKWIEKQNNNQANNSERKQKSPYRNHIPFYQIDPNTIKTSFRIVIPEITKEAPTNNERWYCEIRNDGETVVDSFELPISEELVFENTVFWKTRQISKDVNWKHIFTELSIIVYQSSIDDEANEIEANEIIAEWTINKNTYRLFDINGYQIKKLQVNKENIILVSPGSSFEGKDISSIRRSESISFEKIQFLASSDDAVVKIGDSAIISIAGQYYSEPFFAEERDTIVVEKDGNKIVAAKRHPNISISCLRGEEASIRVTINGTPRRWLDKKYYKVISDISDSNKIIVSFSIESFMFSEDIDGVEDGTNEYLDGLYSVEYGVDGKTIKTISYIILQSFAFRFSRPRFYDSSCELKISKEHSLIPLESGVCSCIGADISDDSYWKKYNITIKPQCEGICFEAKEFGVFLTIPVRKAIYGFNNDVADAVFFRQQASIPFTWIRNTMNIMISGAQEMVLECNGIKSNGQVINLKDGYFRFDLTDVRAGFHNTLPSEIKIRYYDTKARETFVWVHSIKPLSPKKSFSEESNTVYYLLEEIPDGTTCYIDIFADELGDSLIHSLPLGANDHQKLLDLESNKTYWYRRKIVIPSIIPGLPGEVFFIDKKIDRLPFIKLDKDDLLGMYMDIFDGKNKYLYTYTVQIVKKGSARYLGFLFENGRKKYAIAVYDLVVRNNSLAGKIAAFSNDKHLYRLTLQNYELVAKYQEPNDFYFTFDRNSFRKGEI